MKHAHIFQAKLNSKPQIQEGTFLAFLGPKTTTSHAAGTLENVVYNIVLYVHVCTYVYVY